MIKILIYLIAFFFSLNTYSYSSGYTGFTENISNCNIKKDSIQKNLTNGNIGYKMKNIPSDLYENFSSTLSFDKNKLFWLSGIAGITAGFIYTDSKIDSKVKYLKKDHSWINNSSPFLTKFGAGYGVIISGAYAIYSITTGYDKGKETSVLLLESALYSSIWTRLGKFLFGRERPSSFYDNPVHSGGTWHGPLAQINNRGKLPVSSYDAFPSGHTSLAFSLATVFAEQYSSTLYIPIIAYSLATTVGITRTIEHTHWASDVFIGACIGYFSGRSTIMIYKLRLIRNKQKEVKLSIAPYFNNGGIGTNIQF